MRNSRSKNSGISSSFLSEGGLRDGLVSDISLSLTTTPRCIAFSPAIATFLGRLSLQGTYQVTQFASQFRYGHRDPGSNQRGRTSPTSPCRAAKLSCCSTLASFAGASTSQRPTACRPALSEPKRLGWWIRAGELADTYKHTGASRHWTSRTRSRASLSIAAQSRLQLTRGSRRTRSHDCA